MKHGVWIWICDGQESENERVCFQTVFQANDLLHDHELRISAVNRYAVWLNGVFLGSGSPRSGRDTHFFESYGIDHLLAEGENLLSMEVWNYGWSTYQSLAEEGGLWFEVTEDDQILCCSDESVKAARDLGHLPYAPKRNVNLGFTDYYDARKMSRSWTGRRQDCWANAVLSRQKDEKAESLPIRSFNETKAYPDRVIALEDVEKNVQVMTVNTREGFFPGRKDADETIFNGLLGCEIEAEEEMSGRISFPNRSWNGLIGTFRIGAQVYEISDACRDVSVVIPEGRTLFLMQLNGKFDDLYSHIEFRFPRKVCFHRQSSGETFFVLGPTMRLKSPVDGKQPVIDTIDFLTDLDRELFACSTLKELETSAVRLAAETVPEQAGAAQMLQGQAGEGSGLRWLPERYVMEDMYLLSLCRLARTVRSYALQPENMGILWNNTQCTVIEPPQAGDYRRLTVDLGNIFVGELEIALKAAAGTVIDIYGFENRYRGENDYTIGLNNGVRYICKEGWQHYRFLTRMGMRYAIISVRETDWPVLIRDFHMNSRSYSASRQGSFSCSDEKLNRIWTMCRDTHLLCMEDSFTDCPTYEQAFWLGDAQTSAAVNSYVFGDYSFVRHNLLFAASAGDNSPLMNALTPTDWNTSIPMWTMNWLISISDYLKTSGDFSVLDKLYEKIRNVLDCYETLITPEGAFIVHAWNLIDWAKLDTPDGACLTAYQGMLAKCYADAAGYARARGRAQDEERFLSTARKLLTFLDQTLWDPESRTFCDAWNPKTGFTSTRSVQTHSLLMLYHAVIDPEKARIVSNLLENVPDSFVKVGSPFMLYYYYEAQARLGRLSQVFEDIRDRWGEMLRYETTTCWEVFPGFYENSRTRSYCHSWSSAPAALMQKYLLGITCTSDGFASVTAGIPDTDLRWCRGSVPTPHGLIYVDWNRDTKEYLLSIPEQIHLALELPDGYQVRVQKLAERTF